jgi:ABC-type Fe3+ transport system substrate-binding protein
MISDVRHGSIWVPMQWIRTKVAGADDLIKKLLFDQQPLFIRDDRAKAEQIVRKRSAIGLGILPAPLAEFRDAGVAGHVQFLNRAELDYATTYTVLLYNRAPHPNAAKLFINWFLSKEGQTAWCKEIPTNSARTDVPPYFPEGVGERGVQYYFANHESEYERQSATLKWLTDMLGLSS